MHAAHTSGADCNSIPNSLDCKSVTRSTVLHSPPGISFTHMKINLPVDVKNARLPVAYESAKQALAECTRIDECQSWADKAEALASYARQAKDSTLRKQADRIQARAIRRAGELLKAIEPGQGEHWKTKRVGTDPFTRKAAATDAGLSERQRKTALRVASVPTGEFERLVESEEPPTATALAKRGTKRRKRKLRRATVANSVDPLFLKISEVAAMMDKRPAADIVAETQSQFTGGRGLDRGYIERLAFVRDWLDTVIQGSEKFVVTCTTKEN